MMRSIMIINWSAEDVYMYVASTYVCQKWLKMSYKYWDIDSWLMM